MVHETLFKVAEVELTYKPKYKPSERPQISTSKQAHEVFIAHWSLGKIELIEEFKILLLNRRNRVLGIVDISMGGVTETLADPRVIFSVALKSRASGISSVTTIRVKNCNRVKPTSTLRGSYNKVQNSWTS